MNWDEGRSDGVFNDAAGDLCIASPSDTTSTDITDITGLLVSLLHIIPTVKTQTHL